MTIARWSMETGGGWLIVAGLLVLLGLARPLDAAEFACAAGDVACLITAIHAANANGTANTITLAPGFYTLTAVDNNTDGPTGLPSVISPLTLRGAGADSTVLERAAGAPPFRLLHVAPTGTLALDGLTLQGGNLAGLADGGGVRNQGTLRMTHSLLRGHAANSGGGIDSDGTLLITQSTVSGNVTSGRGGGIYTFNARATLTNSTVSGNTAGGVGGGFSLGPAATVTLTNSTVSGNTAGGTGGASMPSLPPSR